MNRCRQTIICLAIPLLTALFPAVSQAAEYTTAFTNWPLTAYTNQLVVDDWILADGGITGEGRGRNEQPFFCDFNPEVTTASLTSAPLTNGVGRVEFVVKSATADSEIAIYLIEGTTTSLWNQVTIYNGASSFTSSTDVISYRDDARVMIAKTNVTSGKSFFLNHVSVFEAPCKVELELPVVLSPTVPLMNDAVAVTATLVPSALASNAVASYLDYVAGVATGRIFMSQSPTNVFEFTTVTDIPGFAEGVSVEMSIAVSFDGPYAHSPTNLVSSYVVEGRDFFSAYSNVNVTGTLVTAGASLSLVADYEWEGVVQPDGSSGNFLLAASPTNQAAPMDLWGDNEQITNQIPFDGTAVIDEDPIDVTNFAFTNLFIRFSETNGAYLLNGCIADDFESWPPQGAVGDYANNDWIITQGEVLQPAAADVYSGQACSLPNPDSSFRSSRLPDGVGEVSFWLRNSAPGATPADITVELSRTGSATSEWQTVDTIANHTVPVFTLYRLPLDMRYHSFVRIRNTGNASIELDSVIIQHSSGAGVTFTNLMHSPTNTTITNQVDVSVDITAFDGTAIQQASLWYRLGTNGIFDSALMNNTSGTTFETVTPIPRGDTGIVQYYVQCDYSSSRGVYGSSLEPLDSQGTYASYTNDDRTVASEDFEDSPWPDHSTVTNISHDGWGATNSYVRGRNGRGQDQPPFDLYLTTYTTDTNLSYLVFPHSPRGIGSVSLDFNGQALGPVDMVVEELAPGDQWIELAAFTLEPNFKGLKEISVEIARPLQIRVRKVTKTNEGQEIRIAKAWLTYPAAQVDASDFQIDPVYPSLADPVYISCTITSATSYHPAFGVEGEIFYRDAAGSTNWLGPIAMARSDTTYTTITNLPIFPAGSTVEYMLQASFKGYHYSDSFSPTTFPTNGPLSYITRRFSSSYGSMATVIGGSSHEMALYSDTDWEVVFSLDPAPTNSMTVDGSDFYDGSQVAPGLGTSWGDEDPGRTEPPYVSVMQPGESGLSLPTNEVGQFVLRFNEVTQEYLLRRCTYQDYENWPASSIYFDESAASREMVIWPLDLAISNGWKTSSADEFEEPFAANAWASVPYPYDGNYEDSQAGTGTFTEIYQSVVIEQAIGYAQQMKPSINGGKIHTIPQAYVDGVGSVSFDVRCVNDDIHHTLNTAESFTDDVMVEASMFAYNIATNDRVYDVDYKSMGHSSLNMYARYVDANNHYRLQVDNDMRNNVAGNPNTRKISLYQVQAGVTTEVLWFHDFSDGLAEMTTYGLALANYTDANGVPQTWYDIYVNGVLRVGSTRELPTVSGNKIGFYPSDADMAINHIKAGQARLQFCRGWPTTATNFVSETRDGWTTRATYIDNNIDDAFRLQASAGAGTPAFVRSPVMSDGIGQVSLSLWGMAGASATAHLQSSTTPDLENSWTTMASYALPNENQHNKVFVANLATPNLYFRVIADVPGAPATAYIKVDNIRIHPHDTLAYSESFGTASSTNAWSNDGGVWFLNAADNTFRRPGFSSPTPMGYDIQVAKVSGAAIGSWSAPLFAATGLTNTHYQHIEVPIHIADKSMIARLNHRQGDDKMIIDNFKVTAWNGDEITASNGWEATAAWLVPSEDAPATTNQLELTRSRALTNEIQAVTSPGFYKLPDGSSNGVGNISFDFKASGDSSVVFSVDRTREQFNGEISTVWDTLTTVTNGISDDWENFSLTMETNYNMRVRVQNISTNKDATLTIKQILVTEPVLLSDETWVGYNALVTSVQSDKLLLYPNNERGGYLNNDPNEDTDNKTFDEAAPRFESAALTNGLGEIDFWYRSWDGQPATLTISAGPSREAPTNQWQTLETLAGITNTVFQRYTAHFSDSNMKYVRFQTDTDSNSTARVCLDNILCAEPYGAYVRVRNLQTLPAVPLANEAVKMELELYETFLAPSNVTITAYYRLGTNDWGSASNPTAALPMVPRAGGGGSQWWETTGSIPAQAIDTVIQYWAVITFEGERAQSPQRSTDFTNPDWYHPIDLNSNGWGPFTPYYYVFSCLPGAVWINEVNLPGDEPEGYFVELCGIKGSDIGNWTLDKVLPGTSVPWQTLTIAPGTEIVDGTNSHAFYLFGEGGQELGDLPAPGGVSLMRSMGAVAHAVSFDYGGGGGAAMTNDPIYRFVYIGSDDDWETESLAATGTGTYEGDFTDWDELAIPSPGSVNSPQVFIPAPDGTNGPPEDISMEIGDISFVGGTQVWFQVEGSSSDLAPVATYNTNLNYDVWVPASNQGFTVSDTVYDVWCDVVTNVPGAFYRIEFDDTP